jgi:alkyldihydroxyacetonephosphate synthase
LKPGNTHWRKKLEDSVKKWYVTKRLKFDPLQMVAATLLFEGTKAQVNAQEKRVYEIASRYGGMKAGEENGVRGYFLTYMIAYLRDFGLNYQYMSESFETSVAYENVSVLCSTVKDYIRNECKQKGINTPFVSCRVTQLYDTGACVYFYFGFAWTGIKDPIGVFSEIEHGARQQILKLGGSLSHHHGVGKLRSSWMEETNSPTGMKLLANVKNSLDPNNIFAAGNIFTTTH